MKVGIAFDIAPTGPTAAPTDGPDDAFEEFDRPETVEAIAAVLRDRGHDVELLGDGAELLRRVLDDPPDLVWNMAEGRGVGRCREARVPAALEMLGIPCTGSDALTLAATLDKEIAKRLVASGGVAVPAGEALRPDLDECRFRKLVTPLFEMTGDRFILKPSFEGSSKGIRSCCLVGRVEEAWTTYRKLARGYQQTILIEEFIAGDEITVGLIGVGDDVEVIGAMRVVPRRPTDSFVYSLEVKRDWRRQVAYEAPARHDDDLGRRLRGAAIDSYALLGCRDVARIDFRVRGGVPYFLEANPLPGLAPGTSDLVILAEGCGLTHRCLIGRIFEAALARLGIVEQGG